MKMSVSKELKSLLAKDEGRWYINDMFFLRHLKYKDCLGIDRDKLELVLNKNTGRTYSIEIAARDTASIQTSVAEGIEELMNDYTADMVRYWKGGLK